MRIEHIAASNRTINTAINQAHQCNSELINSACGFNVVANSTISITVDIIHPMHAILMTTGKSLFG